jgi:acyl dehydratase
MIAPTLTAASLHPGQRAPILERELTQVRMVAYAGATWDWHRLHYETAYAAERNLAAPVVDGQMLGALLAEAIIDWFGPRAFIRRLNFRLRAMVFAGETMRCEGEITGLTPDGDRDLVTVAQRVRVGERLAADGATQVLLPR